MTDYLQTYTIEELEEMAGSRGTKPLPSKKLSPKIYKALLLKRCQEMTLSYNAIHLTTSQVKAPGRNLIKSTNKFIRLDSL